MLGPLLEKTGKGRAVFFPAFGTTEQEGHGAFACRAEGTAASSRRFVRSRRRRFSLTLSGRP
jgi:hypothetical protein